jgi:hypothetical protein
MNPWLLVGPVLVVYALYLCFGHGRWSTSSKHFKLYKVLVDSSKAPDFSITILKGDFPEKTAPGFVTYVRPRIAAKRGLKSRQIVGCLKDFKAAWVPENFSGNKAFKDMIHSIAIRQIPDSVRAKAKTLRTGEVRLIDDRITAPQGDASDEHCIGFYKVENGAVVPYSPNASFQLFSNQGPLELVESIRTVLYSEIANGDSPLGRAPQ